ncbi:mRNA surveillance protein pelota [Candidatus Micrarchaeota archaeon]|nr:mRNA surveillance protein pelota [Candidatus Micrarchaeota archaeon]
MKVLNFDKKEGRMKLVPEVLEDLWHLERVLEPGDAVSSSSTRVFKASEGGEEDRKKVRIELQAEKIDFSKSASKLRVTGKITGGGPEEYIQLGRHHTIDIELQKPVEITKPWKEYQLQRIKKARESSKKPLIGILVMDEGKALFSVIREYGVEFGPELRNHASKGDEKFEERRSQFFGDITKQLGGMKVNRIVIAGPGFAKDNLKKFISERDEELSKKLYFESCSTAEESGVYELLKKEVLSKIASEQKVEEEFSLLQGFLAELSKESGLAVYGVEEVRKAVDYKALGKLLVVDELLRKDKEIEKLLEDAEKMKAEIFLFSSESEAGKQLTGLSGIAGILKFSIR